MQQKIFVTGGTGFVGSYLLRYLVHKGYRHIVAIKRPSSNMALVKEVADKITWVQGDILDIPFLEEAMAGVEQVYHCAAMISFNPRAKERMYQINVEGTANVVNIALTHQIKKLVHVSSIAALGEEDGDKEVTEDSKWKNSKNTSNYAKSKYGAEMEVWRGIAEGLNAAIINPSLILGSGFWDRGTGVIFQMYGNGFPFYSTGVGGVVDVRDVARFAIRLMESDIQGERYIISAENMPYQELFSNIATLAGKKKPYIKLNSWISGIGWRLEWLRTLITRQEPTVTRESINSAGSKKHYQNQKSIRTFAFNYTPIQQTLSDTVAQFQQTEKMGDSIMVLPLN